PKPPIKPPIAPVVLPLPTSESGGEMAASAGDPEPPGAFAGDPEPPGGQQLSAADIEALGEMIINSDLTDL
ncbi:MAG TPA: hypothetical protein VF766_09065, partial [Pyrinomonadaceae bacterium]